MQYKNTVSPRFYILCSVIVLVIAIPFFTSMIFMILGSVGITPTWSVMQFSLTHWKELLSDTFFLSVFTTAIIRGNILALILFIVVFCIGFFITMHPSKLTHMYNIFFLSVPHVALSVGFAFLVAPSGFFLRILAFFFNFVRPPQIVTINDKLGIAMGIVVLLKIIPFVTFSLLSVLRDYTISSHITQARLMGHNHFITWSFVIFPQIMPKIILPFFIALVYAISPVDISMILGPHTPPSLGIVLMQWFFDPERAAFIKANVGCCLLVFASILSVTFWYIFFRCIRRLLQKGYSKPRVVPNLTSFVKSLGILQSVVIVLVTSASLILLVIWSVTEQWQFPSIVPTEFSLNSIAIYGNQIRSSLSVSITLAIISVLVSIILVVFILEFIRHVKFRSLIILLVFVPLFIPQIVYVAGIHILFLWLKINGTIFAVVFSHMQYIIPYMFFTLYGSFMTYDNRYMLLSRSLGKSVFQSTLKVKIPMLWNVLLYAIGIGMLVSTAQYLTTLFIGEGRFQTLTLFMISLSSGGNRQTLGFTGTLLFLINVIVLCLPLLLIHLQKGTKDIRLQ